MSSYDREADLVQDFIHAVLRIDDDAPFYVATVAKEFDFRSGRADVITVTWGGEVVAFEAKLSRWREALHQAYRNTCFAHQSYVVLPWRIAERAATFQSEFEQRGVGICSLNSGCLVIVLEAPRLEPLQSWLADLAVEHANIQRIVSDGVDDELQRIARAICDQSGYLYVGRVGEGAFKETFEAHENDVVHALKVFRPGAKSERIEREIAAMLQCSHPNIARLRRLDTIVVAGEGLALYTVEEFLSGGTLAKRIEASLLTSLEALAMGELLVSAVGHIASHDLVHRDIKLENIMLREDRQTPVIVDFGLVRTLRETSLTVTWAERGPGTPFYAPPEQLCNDKHLIDWRADQFSLGVALSLATLGRHPYGPRADESSSDIVARVASRTAVPREFAALAAQLPALVRMVAPWPVERYRTPDELAGAWRAQRGNL